MWHEKKIQPPLSPTGILSNSLATNGSKMLFPAVQNHCYGCTDFSKPQLQKLYHNTLYWIIKRVIKWKIAIFVENGESNNETNTKQPTLLSEQASKIFATNGTTYSNS